MMRLLYLVDRVKVKHKLDQNRMHSYNAVRRLVEARGGTVVIFGPNFDKWKDDETVSANVARAFPTVSFDLVWAYDIDVSCDGVAPHVVVATNELYMDHHMKRLLGMKPTYVVLHHTNERDQIDLPTVHIPHAADTSVFYASRTVPKLYDFLLVGYTTDSLTYPLRNKLKGVCTELHRRGYSVHMHRHPGYNHTKPHVQVAAYVKAIQQAKVVMTCSSVYKYRLSKMAEIPMCNAALATDVPHDGADFFRKFVIELDATHTIAQHAEVLIQGLKQWKQHASRGYEMTMNTSTQEHYAHRFLQAYATMSSKPQTMRVLLVVDVHGWAWDHKAKAIQQFYKGPSRITVCTEAEYRSDKHPYLYDHIHFFSWRKPCEVANKRVRAGLLRASVTIASSFDFVHHTVAEVQSKVEYSDVVAVSPYLADECRRLNVGRTVVDCYNGVNTTLFRPLLPLKATVPLRVLICNKPRPKIKYDTHGYTIAEALTQRFKNHPTIRVTFHVANYRTKTCRPQAAMVAMYQAHDVFVHCGRRHLGTPNMAFEAAACKLAIVSTANGCLPALFRDRNSMLVPLPEPLGIERSNHDEAIVHALAEHLEALDKDRILLNAHQEEAYNAVIQGHWTWAERAQDYGKVFNLPIIN